MPNNENVNLDTWRITRNKNRREDDLFIDQLCDTLLQLQNKCAELERRLGEASERPANPRWHLGAPPDNDAIPSHSGD